MSNVYVRSLFQQNCYYRPRSVCSNRNNCTCFARWHRRRSIASNTATGQTGCLTGSYPSNNLPRRKSLRSPCPNLVLVGAIIGVRGIALSAEYCGIKSDGIPWLAKVRGMQSDDMIFNRLFQGTVKKIVHCVIRQLPWRRALHVAPMLFAVH